MPIRLAEGSEIRLDDGRRLTLGKLLKSGGAGSVYLLPGASELVAKVYHESIDLALYERKVTAMLAYSPDLPDLQSPEDAPQGGDSEGRVVQIAWPRSLLRDARGQFRGFVMPKLDFKATIELEYVLQERQARAESLPTGLGARLTLATNLSALLAALHRERYFVVDLKPLNVRFYRRSLYLAMLDCDGFSLHSPRERFPALQFTAEYFAPELQAGGLTGRRDTQVAEEAQDLFAFAVIAFQLLNFGIHPYSGQPLDDRVPTDLPGRIAGHFYAYGATAHPRIRPSRVSGHTLMPPVLRALFDQAFSRDAARRPSAQEWKQALSRYALRSGLLLGTCATDPTHQHFVGLACAACARAALIGQVGAQAEATRKARTRTAAHAATAPAGPRRPRRRVATASAPAVSLPAGNKPAGPPVATTPMGPMGWAISIVLSLLAVVTALPRSCGTSPASTTYSSAAPTALVSKTNGSAHQWDERADAQLDSVLRAVAEDDAEGFRDGLRQLGEAASRPPQVAAQRVRDANQAAAEYLDSFVGRRNTTAEEGSAARLVAQGKLEQAYVANPYRSDIAAELSVMQLTAQRLSGRASTSIAASEARSAGLLPPAGQASDALPTLRRAVVLDPGVSARWSALALGCLHHNDIPCAESAFAVNLLLQLESGGAGSHAAKLGQVRSDMTEWFFGGAGKAQLQAAKARGLQHAVRLGGAAMADLVGEHTPAPARVDDLAGGYAEGAGLIPLCVNAHYRACGLLDRQGAWRVTPRFSKIAENAGGWTVETAAGGQGLLDRDGRQLIEPLWHELGRFGSGLLPAQTAHNAPYGYVDARGRWVIAPQFMYPAAFNRNAALVWIAGKTFDQRRLALVDTAGKLNFLSYSNTRDASTDRNLDRDGRFVVTNGSDRATELGVIDDTGRVRVPLALRQDLELVPGGNWIEYRTGSPNASGPAFTLYSGDARRLFTLSGAEAHIRTPHANGHAVFTDAAGREGLVDLRTGQVKIAPSLRMLGILYDDRISFSEDVNGVTRYGYLDLRGRVLIAPQFDNAPTFDRGFAAVCEARPQVPGGSTLTWEQSQKCRVVDSRGRELEVFTRFGAHSIRLGAWTDGGQDEVVRDIVKVERRRVPAPGERPASASDAATARETLLTTRSGDVLVRVQTDPACDAERVVNARGEVIWPLQDSVLCELKEVGRTLPAGASPALARAFAERAAFKAAEERDRLRLRLRSYGGGVPEPTTPSDSATAPTNDLGR